MKNLRLTKTLTAKFLYAKLQIMQVIPTHIL